MRIMSRLSLVLVTCVVIFTASVSANPSGLRLSRLGSLLINDLLDNHCGGETVKGLCSDCMEATHNENAFLWCCKDELGVREWCKSYLEYTLERR